MSEGVDTTVETLLVLLLVVFAVAVAVQWIRLPYPIALVVTGLLGFQPGFRHIYLTPDLILTVFLPVLLFEGAYNVSAKRLRGDLLPIVLLAGPGVLLGTVVTGAIVHAALGLPWGVVFLFGALISSTDPIAVISLFRRLGVPRRLALLVEGESLFNDGAAITLFQIVLAAIITGQFSIGEGLLRFAVTVAGALIVGAGIGYGGSLLMRAVDNAQVQITATVIAAYGSYLLAERFTFSGAIAVVVTALLFGNYGTLGGLSPVSVRALSGTWEFMGFVANSLIFLLIGIELDPLVLARSWWLIAIAFLAALAGRAVADFVLMPLVRGRWTIPGKFLPVILWGGLRGAVSLALVLSVPFNLPNGQGFPHRSLLQLLAFGVVGVSLLLQGLTMGPFIRLLGLARETDAGDNLASVRARLHAVEGTLLALEHEYEQGEIGSLHYERLKRAYQTDLEQLQRQMEHLQASSSEAQ